MSARTATTGPGFEPFSRATTPCLAITSLNFVEPERAKFLGDHTRGALFAIRKLGVHVEVAALFDKSCAHRFGCLSDLLLASCGAGSRKRDLSCESKKKY